MKKFDINIKLCKAMAICATAVIFASCEDNPHDDQQSQYVIIKNENLTPIENDTIAVAINTVHQTLIEICYEDKNYPYFTRQIDEKNIETLKNGNNDFQFEYGAENSNGYSSYRVTITTHFTDSLMHVGSIVKIGARAGLSMAKYAYYEVVE